MPRQFPSKTRKLLSDAQQCRRLGALCGTDDDRGRIRRRRSQGTARAAFGSIAAGLPVHRRYQTPYAECRQSSRRRGLFVERGFQEPANAYEEARRGAYDPTYLYYTAGKLQIYKLREDYKRAHGSAYSLEKFHTEFIKQGSIPIKLMRRILLKDDQSPAL